MSQRKKKRTKRARSAESRSVEVLTIFWLLAVMTTLVCELGFVGARVYVAWYRPLAPIELLGSLLLFAAAVIGFVTLVLTPAVIKSRRLPPPRGVTVLALVVGGAPWVTMLVQLLQ